MVAVLEPTKTLSRSPEGLAEPSEDDDLDHWSCHCTDYKVSMCRLDMTNVPFFDEEIEDESCCPMCELADPADAPTCPWGCDCEDECGPG